MRLNNPSIEALPQIMLPGVQRTFLRVHLSDTSPRTGKNLQSQETSPGPKFAEASLLQMVFSCKPRSC
jgi:hypothetical protein